MRTWTLLLLLASSLFAAGQSHSTNAASAPQSSQPSQVKQETDELRQQLDIDAAALSKIPTDPLISPDPLGPILQPADKLIDRLAPSARLKFGASIRSWIENMRKAWN